MDRNRAFIVIALEHQPHLLGVEAAHLFLLLGPKRRDFELVRPEPNLFPKPRPAQLPQRKRCQSAAGNGKTSRARNEKFGHADQQRQACETGEG